MITVKIAKLGQAVTTVTVPEGSTLEFALEESGMSVDRDQLRLNGAAVESSTLVENGDVATLIPAIKGG